MVPSSESEFVEVIIDQRRRGRPATLRFLEVVSRGGVRIRFTHGADPAVVRVVVAAVLDREAPFSFSGDSSC